MRVIDSSKASDFFVDSEGPDQTVRMRSLIWVFAVRICPKIPIRLSMSLKILLFPGERPPAWTECNIGNDLWVVNLGAYVISYWFLASTERSQCIIDHDSWPGQESRYAKMGPCLFVLRFHGPVNLMGSCWARSVYLISLSRLRSI